jgi:hypothetical protein
MFVKKEFDIYYASDWCHTLLGNLFVIHKSKKSFLIKI